MPTSFGQAMILTLAIIIPGGLLVYFAWKGHKRLQARKEHDSDGVEKRLRRLELRYKARVESNKRIRAARSMRKSLTPKKGLPKKGLPKYIRPKR